MLRAGPSALIERGLQGRGARAAAATPPPPRVSLIRCRRRARRRDTRRTAITAARRRRRRSDDGARAVGRAAGRRRCGERQCGRHAFPAGLEAARTGIRGDLAAFDLRSGGVGPCARSSTIRRKCGWRRMSRVVGGVRGQARDRPRSTVPRPGRRWIPVQLRDRRRRPAPAEVSAAGSAIGSTCHSRSATIRCTIMAHPEFPAPLALALVQEAPNAILPGLGTFPNNRVALLETNPSVHRGLPRRRQPRDESRVPVARVPDRSARHALQALLAAPAGGGSDGREIEEIARWRRSTPRHQSRRRSRRGDGAAGAR